MYRERRPFDAEKLWAFLHEEGRWDGVLRSKGFFWTAARHPVAYEWSQAGGVSEVRPAGRWWAAVPREARGHPEGEQPDQQPQWDARYGDRMQELVFIGTGLDEAAWRRALDACLLGDGLLRRGSEAWRELRSPLPELPVFPEGPERRAAPLTSGSGDSPLAMSVARLRRYVESDISMHMRTTIEINEALARRVRALMAERNTTLRALVEEGLRKVVEESREPHRFRLRDASAGDGGLADGVDDASWEMLSRFLYPRAS